MNSSKPITIRVPEDILEIIDDKAEALGGKGNRTEVMLNLIRKALDLPIPVISESIERTEKLEKRMEAVETEVQKIWGIIEDIRQKSTESDKEEETEDISQKTEIITVKESDEPLQLELNSPTMTKKERVIGSSELMSILRDKASHKKWNGTNLRPYRTGKKQEHWHEFGDFRFKFKGIKPNSKNQKDKYLWSVIDS